MSVSGLPSAAPVSRKSRLIKSEKSDALVLLSVYTADQQHDSYCSLSFGRSYSIGCHGNGHKASRKSRIVKSEKSDHLERYVNRTEAWGPVKPGLREENTQVAARTQGKNPVSESRSASKTGEERGGQKCKRTNSKS